MGNQWAACGPRRMDLGPVFYDFKCQSKDFALYPANIWRVLIWKVRVRICRREGEQFEDNWSVQTRNNEVLRGWQQQSEGENDAKEDWCFWVPGWIPVPWIGRENMGERGAMSLGLRCLRDMWAAKFRSFGAVTHEYGRRLGDREIGSWLVSSGRMCKLKDMRRSRRGMRKVMLRKSKNCANRTRLDVPATMYSFECCAWHKFRGTIPDVDYMSGGIWNYAVCSQHGWKCQIWPWD